MMRIFALMALVVMLGSSAASAGERGGSGRSGTDAEQRACMPDVFRLCSEAIPDEKRIVACLKSKKAKLSRACRKVMS
jgi:hypothetical protein